MQKIIINPEEHFACKCCSKWSRYASNPNWGKCTVKDVPHYMREIFLKNGCNLHSNIFNKKITKCCDDKQLSIFDN